VAQLLDELGAADYFEGLLKTRLERRENRTFVA